MAGKLEEKPPTELVKGERVEFTAAGKTYVAVARLGTKQADFYPIPKPPEKGEAGYEAKMKKWEDDCAKIADACGVVIYRKEGDKYTEIKEPSKGLLAKAGEKVKDTAEWRIKKEKLEKVPKIKEEV